MCRGGHRHTASSPVCCAAPIRPLEQLQHLLLRLLRLRAGGRCVLGRPLLTPVAPSCRRSGPLVGRMLWRLLPPGPRPLSHSQNLLGQPGQVRVVEGLDVRVRRGPLHTDGGSAALDGDDDLQVVRRGGLVPGVIGPLRFLFGTLCSVESCSSTAAAAAGSSSASPKRASSALGASERVASVPTSSGMVFSFPVWCSFRGER